MKNLKLKKALKKVKNNDSFEKLGIEEIRTVKGGQVPPSGCTSGNCSMQNCGWN